MSTRFLNRSHAGTILAERLASYGRHQDVIVLALPRGGVPVGYQVACALHAPLDVFIVRKLGVPGQRELAMGAIASGGIRVLNETVIESLQIPDYVIAETAREELLELQRRQELYRGSRPLPDLHHHRVILVDDGLATGSTMRAAALAVRQQQPQSLVIAVPVGASETCQALRPLADDFICVMTPEPFYAVGLWYEHFEQTSDEEVRSLLERADAKLCLQ